MATGYQVNVNATVLVTDYDQCKSLQSKLNGVIDDYTVQFLNLTAECVAIDETASEEAASEQQAAPDPTGSYGAYGS
jgi:division protein CdvB (Snf7/Vps24/ESCRT-III family)